MNRIIKIIESHKSKAIFLGDYVDRGNFSLECIILLFSLKVLKPDKYFLIRGNHEFDSMCSKYGFKKEILNYHNPKKTNETSEDSIKPRAIDEFVFEFEEEEEEKENENLQLTQEVRCDDYYANHININCYKYTEKLYDAFVNTFSYLPICSIVNKTSICLHGGLSPLLDKVENINQIQRPVIDFDDNLLLSDIVWGDPSLHSSTFYNDNPRGRGKLYNGTVIVNFLKNNNLKRLIRGHECVSNGIDDLFNEKCFTVFSASSYSRDMGNSSGILKIYRENDEIETIINNPLHRLKKYDAVYYKLQSFSQAQNNKSRFSVCNQIITQYKSGFLFSKSNLSTYKSDQCIRSHLKPSSNKQLTLGETDNLGKKGLSCECFSMCGRKSRLISKFPLLKSGPRKKITSSSTCLLAKEPHILAPQTKNQAICFQSNS